MSLDTIKEIWDKKDFGEISTGQKISIGNLEAYFIGMERRESDTGMNPIIAYKQEGQIIEMQINLMGVGKVFDYEKSTINKDNDRFEFYQKTVGDKE